MGIFTHQLLAVAAAYCEGAGVSLSTASRRAFEESKLLVNLAAGVSSPTFKRADVALEWFSRNWPEGSVWPDDLPRPPREDAHCDEGAEA